MRLNWRGHVARAENYYDLGQAQVARIKNLLVIGAALKILGLSTLWLVLLAPVLIVGHVVFGWAWVRWGWYRQATETALIARWTPLQVAEAWWKIRTLKALGIDANGFDPSRLPEEYAAIFASARREHGGA